MTELTDINSKFLCIGTSDIQEWTDGKPFIIPLNDEDDFDANGLDYSDYADMEVGEVRCDDNYTGIMVIRMAWVETKYHEYKVISVEPNTDKPSYYGKYKYGYEDKEGHVRTFYGDEEKSVGDIVKVEYED